MENRIKAIVVIILLSLFSFGCGDDTEWSTVYRGLPVSADDLCGRSQKFYMDQLRPAADAVLLELGANDFHEISGRDVPGVTFTGSTKMSMDCARSFYLDSCTGKSFTTWIRCDDKPKPFFPYEDNIKATLLGVFIDIQRDGVLGNLEWSNKCHWDPEYANTGTQCIVENPMMYRWTCGDNDADSCLSEWESKGVCNRTFKGESVCTRNPWD